MSAFAWLNDLMQWVARWVPRVRLIRETHRGILFQRAGRTLQIEPGLCWHWPLVSELEQVSMLERSSLTSAQLVGCRLVALVIVYRVTDALACALRYRQINSRIENEAKIAATRTDANAERIKEHLVQTFGDVVEVIDVCASSDGEGFALKQFGDWADFETMR